MFEKRPIVFCYVQSLVDDFIKLITSRKDVKCFDMGNGQVIISTLSPNFKNLSEGLSWKPNVIVDFINRIYKFCQSDPAAADNWTQIICDIMRELLMKVYPDFSYTYYRFLPENKKYLIEELYNQIISCSEVIFSFKELIAFYNLLKAIENKNMTRDEVTSILHSLGIKKDDEIIYPYNGTLEESVVMVLEGIINLFKSNPVPAELKKHGRKAYAFGYFAFGKTEQAKEDASKLGVNLEDELVKALVVCKTLIISQNENSLKLWKFLYENQFITMEVSINDETWGSVVVSEELTKENPKPDGVSVIGHLVALVGGLTVDETQSLKNWAKEPFTGEFMEKIKTIGSHEDGFYDLVIKGGFTKPGKNRLSNVNNDVMENLASKYNWTIAASA
jgi:hypothetical protein